MKRSFLLSLSAAAACCSADAAASLRGEGVEEVGEQIEHFPPEHTYVDRRLLASAPEHSVRRALEAPTDAWPDQDIVGTVVDNEDASYVTPFVEPRMANSCDGEDESEFRIMLTTDLYGYETSWKLLRTVGNDRTIAEGPPDGTNYGDASVYAGRWCLPPGRYKFQALDAGGDGICSDNPVFGCGSLRLIMDGQDVGRIDDTSNWSTKNFFLDVGASAESISGRIDGANNGNAGGNNGNGQGEWCSKVRSVMQVPQGTCRLPNGRRGHRVRVTTTVDRYGEETSWTIATRRSFRGTLGNGLREDMDVGNSAVRMKMGQVVPPNGRVSVEDCLAPGKYNLMVEDIDGVCCRHGEGSFKLYVDGELLVEGGTFTKEVNHDFQLGFDWVDSMNERDCEWWWAHDYRRRDWHTRCYDGQYCDKSYRHLKWSPALAEDARLYAEDLLDTCDTKGILHEPGNAQGENLAKNKGSGNWGAKYPADKVTKRFVDNEEFWGWNGNAHLTQAMWYPSRYLGCGESVRDMGNGKMCRMQVCRYAKAGNCQMGKFQSDTGNNWMTPMMMDDSPCGPTCASRDGCYH